jgi:hypothetical protein
MRVHGHEGEDVSCHASSLPYPAGLRTSGLTGAGQSTAGDRQGR